MSRILAIAGLFAVGFGVAAATPAAAPNPAEGIDYAKFTAVNEKPIQVEMRLLTLCSVRVGEKEIKDTFGPHLGGGVKYFLNAEAEKAVKADPKAAMPVGAIIVKEKLKLADGKATKLTAYGAMVKREKGYDPEHGDWEYVYADLSGATPKIERGKIESCARCHAIAKERDYLYRTNLTKPAKK